MQSFRLIGNIFESKNFSIQAFAKKMIKVETKLMNEVSPISSKTNQVILEQKLP